MKIMKNHIKFIPVGADSIAKYFQYACILPHRFLNDIHNDCQSLNKDYIMCSDQRWCSSENYSLEVYFLENEQIDLMEMDDLLFYHGFLPISRIKKIHVRGNDEKIKDQTANLIWNINRGTAFVPDRLIEYDQNVGLDNTKTECLISEVGESKRNELEKKLLHFDRTLGAVAFMRLALHDLNDTNLNYPAHYLNVLAHFNTHAFLVDKVEVQQLSNRMRSLLDRSSPLLNYIFKDIDDAVLEEMASQEGAKLNRKLGDYDFSKLDIESNTFFLGLLYRYGKGKEKRESIQDFLSTKFLELPWHLREEVSFYMGANSKYSSFYNYYLVAGREINIKFQLDKMFDYYIIESLYSFVVNNRLNNIKLDYLEDFNFGIQLRRKMIIPSYISVYSFGENLILQKRNYDREKYILLDNLTSKFLSWFNFPFDIPLKGVKDYFGRIIDESFNQLVERVEGDLERDYKEKIELDRSEYIKIVGAEKEFKSSAESIKEKDVVYVENDGDNKFVSQYKSHPDVLGEPIECYSKEELEKMNGPKLYDIIKSLGIKGLSKANNEKRIMSILKWYDSNMNDLGFSGEVGDTDSDTKGSESQGKLF